MALVTDYDEEYLGVGEVKPPFPQHNKEEIAEMENRKAAEAAQPSACASCNESKSACESCKDNVIVLGGQDGD